MSDNTLSLLIILCYNVFVTGKGDLYKCCTPMDFTNHRALIIIRDPGFTHLRLAGLEGKKAHCGVEGTLWSCRRIAFLAPFQQLALCSAADLPFPPMLCLVCVHIT